MKSTTVPRWTYSDCAVFDGEGSLAARARCAEDARRIAAAVNFVECVSTEALEGWTVGVVRDPVNDLAEELESLLTAAVPGERRSGEDRRRSDRRCLATQVRALPERAEVV
jgi:hypothetical protein